MAVHSQVQQKTDITPRKLGLGSINSNLSLSTTQRNQMEAWLSPLLAPIMKGKKEILEEYHWGHELKDCSNQKFQNTHISDCHEDFMVCSHIADMGVQPFLFLKKEHFLIYVHSKSPSFYDLATRWQKIVLCNKHKTSGFSWKLQIFFFNYFVSSFCFWKYIFSSFATSCET